MALITEEIPRVQNFLPDRELDKDYTCFLF